MARLLVFLTFASMILLLGCGDDGGPGPDGDGSTGDCLTETCNGEDDDCDGRVDEDFDFVTDPANCGYCNVHCVIPNGSGVCDRAACQPIVASCNGSWQDCDGDGSNGCEANTANRADHCGGCGSACADGQSCVNSVCE
jgi:hypothetical protein